MTAVANRRNICLFIISGGSAVAVVSCNQTGLSAVFKFLNCIRHNKFMVLFSFGNISENVLPNSSYVLIIVSRNPFLLLITNPHSAYIIRSTANKVKILPVSCGTGLSGYFRPVPSLDVTTVCIILFITNAVDSLITCL